MLTDYSSVAFDMALLQKPIIYYQFDRDNFFGGGHTLQRGYFDYDRDGFGPVGFDKNSLLDYISNLLSQDVQPEEKYLKRMTDFFPFRDGKNCERNYQAIKVLDTLDVEMSIKSSALRLHALSADRFGDWPLAEHRWREYLRTLSKDIDRKEAQVQLAKSINYQDQFILNDITVGQLMMSAKSNSLEI